MSIDIRTFASGDTDYIAKLNENYATIKAAIDQLQAMAGSAGGPGSAVSAGFMIDALFNHQDGLVGPHAYQPTYSGGTLLVDTGAMYLADMQSVVQWFATTTLNFAGSTPGIYYVVVSATGLPVKRDTPEAGAAWSVQWTGGGFVGQPVRYAPTFFDTSESTAARISRALAGPESPPLPAIEYDTLDERLEAGEERLSAVEQIVDTVAGTTRVRKVGCTVSATGVVGAIQVDFFGTIVGWSVIGDVVGNLTVEVDRKASSPPPAAPGIPNTTTDKISGSTPIALSAAQSASRATISGWNVSVNQWDVLQFNCTVLGTIKTATLYLLIDEITSP